MSRILIIDDCATLTDGMRSKLEWAGFELLEARDGLAGLQRAVEELPDLILIETDLFGLDGFELAARLDRDEQTSSIPVLLCSGSWNPATVERARACGALDHLVVPMQAGPLVSRIERMLAERPVSAGVGTERSLARVRVGEAMFG